MPSGVYIRTKEHIENMKKSLNKPEVIEKNRQRALRQWKNGSFDEDVKRRSERMKGNQYSKGHKQTQEHKDNISKANKDKNSASYIDGRSLKQYYCSDCEREISVGKKRCGSCNGKKNWKDDKYRKKNKTSNGHKHTKETRDKLKNGLDRHHIYLKENSDKTILLTGPKHRQLHARAYNYLVEIKKVDNYIKWFDNKYSLFDGVNKNDTNNV